MDKNLPISDIISQIHKGAELPTLAPVMRQIVALTAEREMDNEALTRIICRDAALTTRLIRSANSPNQYQAPVYNVRDAMNRLGQSGVRNLALSTPYIDAIDDSNLFATFQWMWERHLFNAAGAHFYAHKLNLGGGFDYWTIGLLMDMGALFLLYNFTEIYRPLIERWMNTGGDLSIQEEEELGFTHTVVGQYLARTWNLGQDIEMTIRYHHFSQYSGDTNLDFRLLGLTQLSTAFFFEDRYVSGLQPAAEFAEQNFNIDGAKIQELLQQISIEADSAAIQIASGPGATTPSIDLMRTINRELGRATLTYDQLVRELETAVKKIENLAHKLEETNQRLREVSNYDPLTKVYNRRYFDEFLTWNFNRATRYETTLGCLMIDLDHFKKVNDTHGHLSGDQVLQSVAAALQKTLRNTDIIARYGGEEFVVLLPETNPRSVRLTAKRAHKAISKVKVEAGGSVISVTASIGFVAFNREDCPDINTPGDLVETADKRMYQAKNHGRDQIWPPEDEENSSV
ncbi:MAG: diguanylate cyclase [Calditrichota bacterium]